MEKWNQKLRNQLQENARNITESDAYENESLERVENPMIGCCYGDRWCWRGGIWTENQANAKPDGNGGDLRSISTTVSSCIGLVGPKKYPRHPVSCHRTDWQRHLKQAQEGTGLHEPTAKTGRTGIREKSLPAVGIEDWVVRIQCNTRSGLHVLRAVHNAFIDWDAYQLMYSNSIF